MNLSEVENYNKGIVSILSKSDTLGTGFFIDESIIITASHVCVSEDLVASIDGREYSLVIIEKDIKNDIAVLNIEYKCKKNNVFRITDSANINKGDEFYSFGYVKLDDIIGVSAKIEILGSLGSEPNLLHLKSQDINHGMSGAPVIHIKSGLVVGMIDSTFDSSGNRHRDTSYAIKSMILYEKIIKKISNTIKPIDYHEFELNEILLRKISLLTSKNIYQEENIEKIYYKCPIRFNHKIINSDTLIKDIKKDDAPNLLILGEAGSGKSILSSYIYIQLLKEKIRGKTNILPILIKGEEVEEKHLSSKFSFNKYVTKILEEFEVCEGILNRHRIVIILDGLDELLTKHNITHRLFNVHNNMKFVVTSRYNSNSHGLSQIFPLYEICTLSHKDAKEILKNHSNDNDVKILRKFPSFCIKNPFFLVAGLELYNVTGMIPNSKPRIMDLLVRARLQDDNYSPIKDFKNHLYILSDISYLSYAKKNKLLKSDAINILMENHGFSKIDSVNIVDNWDVKNIARLSNEYLFFWHSEFKEYFLAYRTKLMMEIDIANKNNKFKRISKKWQNNKNYLNASTAISLIDNGNKILLKILLKDYIFDIKVIAEAVEKINNKRSYKVFIHKIRSIYKNNSKYFGVKLVFSILTIILIFYLSSDLPYINYFYVSAYDFVYRNTEYAIYFIIGTSLLIELYRVVINRYKSSRYLTPSVVSVATLTYNSNIQNDTLNYFVHLSNLPASIKSSHLSVAWLYLKKNRNVIDNKESRPEGVGAEKFGISDEKSYQKSLIYDIKNSSTSIEKIINITLSIEYFYKKIYKNKSSRDYYTLLKIISNSYKELNLIDRSQIHVNLEYKISQFVEEVGLKKPTIISLYKYKFKRIFEIARPDIKEVKRLFYYSLLILLLSTIMYITLQIIGIFGYIVSEFRVWWYYF